MEAKLTFVPVTTDEQIETCARLANVIWHECYERILAPGQIDYMVEHMQSAGPIARQIREDGYEYFLICPPGEAAVGYLSIRAGGGKLLLSKLYLLAEERGKGYAQPSLAFAEAAGRERGCVALWLTVNRQNERAIAIYRKTGYQLTREEAADIGGGYVMDDYIFEKPL